MWTADCDLPCDLLFSVRKRVIRLQIIEKSVESSRSSPETGAGEGIRTLDPNLGKVVLYPWATPAIMV